MLSLTSFCFVVNLFINSTRHPNNIYTCIYISMHVYIYIHVCIYVHVYIYTCIYIYVAYYVTMYRMNVSAYWIIYKKNTNIKRNCDTLIL